MSYRVRSTRGTQFRRWATERLKNPPVANSGVPDRFDELLERVRDIQASERRMYLRAWQTSMSKNRRNDRPARRPIVELCRSRLTPGQALPLGLGATGEIWKSWARRPRFAF